MPLLSNKGFLARYGEWALVAGAAEGIGEAFSMVLAEKGFNIIMVDCNAESLHHLAEKITGRFRVATLEVILDLSVNDAWIHCMKAIENRECRLMVYIPAYSKIKPFLTNSTEELDNYLDLNCRTPFHLVHSFSKSIPENKPGGIILMSSLAGLIGPPYSAAYAATKAFNIVLTESLFSEFRKTGKDITVCCAGQTSTPTYWASKPHLKGNWPGVMKPEDIAESALRNLGRKAISIPGWKNRISYFLLTRLLPRPVAAKMIGSAIRKMYPDVNS